jgi:2'-5' RNA ligase
VTGIEGHRVKLTVEQILTSAARLIGAFASLVRLLSEPRQLRYDLAMLDNQLRFQLIWLVGYARLRVTAGRRSFDLPPAGIEAANHLTTVVRVPADMATILTAAQARLKRWDSSHYYYPPTTLHLTISNLDHVTSSFRDQVSTVLEGFRPFDLLVRGLSVSPTTVFAQALPEDSAVQELRRRLWAREPKPLLPELVSRAMRHLCFINLVRFRGPVSSELLTEVARLRTLPVGRFSVTEIELVRTDRFLSDAGTQVLERFSLDASSGDA